MGTGHGVTSFGFSRRRLIQGGVGLLGAAATGALSTQQVGAARAGEPKPIPGGFAEDFSLVPEDPLIHVLPPSVGFEMSTITDFRGVIGSAEIRGTATDGDTTYDFDCDMRFMKGQYVDINGKMGDAAFAFV